MGWAIDFKKKIRVNIKLTKIMSRKLKKLRDWFKYLVEKLNAISVGSTVILTINRPHYNVKLVEINERIEELEEDIREEEKRILAYSIATPRDIILEDIDKGFINEDVDPFHEITFNVQESLQWLGEYHIELYQLKLLKEHLKNNGKVSEG